MLLQPPANERSPGQNLEPEDESDDTVSDAVDRQPSTITTTTEEPSVTDTESISDGKVSKATLIMSLHYVLISFADPKVTSAELMVLLI